MDKNESPLLDSKKPHGIDIPFFVLVVLLMLTGLIMMFSASAASALNEFSDSYHYVKLQFTWMTIGFAAMIVTIFINYNIYRRLAVPLLVVSIALLALVLIVGTEVNGATRWFYIGSVSVQPSEIAKLAVVISFAHFISKNSKNLKSFTKCILPLVAILGVIAALLIVEPHLSGTILILVVGFIVMIVGGLNGKWLAAVGTVGAVAMVFIMMFTTHGRERIETWLDPFADPRDKGFQILQSMYAIGSGGLLGLGLGNSRQKYLYIPEPQNDFIFAITAEEMGFVGALVIIVLFALLVWRGFIIAFKAPDRFSSLVVVGIVARVGLQAILNIAVVTNSMPNTGISLPFFSYGGTSLMILLFEMGIVLCISRYTTSGSG